MSNIKNMAGVKVEVLTALGASKHKEQLQNFLTNLFKKPVQMLHMDTCMIQDTELIEDYIVTTIVYNEFSSITV